MIKINDQYIKIDTMMTSMIISYKAEIPELLYYGKKIKDNDSYAFFRHSIKGKRFGSVSDRNVFPTIMSFTGDGCQKESLLRVVKNGIFTNRFVLNDAFLVDGFESCLPTARRKGDTVCLTYTDLVSGVTLKQYFTVFDDSDVIATHTELTNTSNDEVRVTRLMSLQLDFVADSAIISTFDGQWLAERTRHNTVLRSGRYENSSIMGISSGEHNPFIMVNINGAYMGFNLVWSGNHKELVEVSPYGKVRVMTGMNDYALDYPIAPGESLVSPEAIVSLADNEADLTHILQKFALDHIVNPDFAYHDRPVLINNWEGTYFNFTGEKIYEMAKQASECGIEMMVLDDGWFGERNNPKCGLGDWYDNVEKTGGLKNLADRIKALGMKFGLWVEPEMISQDSDLFRAHPEFAQAIPGVLPMEKRYQLCIDLCNDEVVDYLADTLIHLFKEIDLDYVKWDHNRTMVDVFSSRLETQGRYFYDYYKNQTRLLRRITEACPNILFESCSSGGCRYDLSMMYFMPQAWGSDNTNAYYRLFIQEGTLTAYPQSSMGAHVASPHSIPKINLESRFNIASIGAFGYEFDITMLDQSDLDTVTQQVEFYKKHRHLLQFGNYIKLGEGLIDSDIGGWIVVSEDKSEAMATVVSKTEGVGFKPQFVSFEGLDPNALYHVKTRKQRNYETEIEFTAYGDALMNGQFDFDVLAINETDSGDFSSRFASRMVYFKKV